MNKNLPVLKFFLYPAFGYFAYSGYCYYSQQYFKKVQSVYMPIKFYQELHKMYDNANTIFELQRTLYNTVRHTDIFIINPSLSNRKLIKSDLQIINQKKLLTEYKINKQMQINHFNGLKIEKQGKFLLGLWNQYEQSSDIWIGNTEVCMATLEKMVKNRQKKCRKIAENEKFITKNFTQIYEQCLDKTKTSSIQLRKFIQIIKTMNKQ